MNTAAVRALRLAADVAQAVKATAITVAVLADRAHIACFVKAADFDNAHRRTNREIPR